MICDIRAIIKILIFTLKIHLKSFVYVFYIVNRWFEIPGTLYPRDHAASSVDYFGNLLLIGGNQVNIF